MIGISLRNNELEWSGAWTEGCSVGLDMYKIQTGNLSVFPNAHFENNFLVVIRAREQKNECLKCAPHRSV